MKRHLISRRKDQITIPTNGEYSSGFQSTIRAKVRAHMWYFVISDCQQQLKEKLPKNTRGSLEIDIHMTNVGNTEFSLEEFGIPQFTFLITLLDIFMILYNGKIILDRHKKYDEFSLPLFLLVLTLSIETLSYLLNLFHLWVYSDNGMGVLTFRIISVILQITSQFLLTMILVMLSWGWQINFMKITNFEIFIPLTFLVAFFQLSIVGVGFLDHDAYHKDHAYEGIVGWVASTIFLFEFGYFMNGIIETYKQSNSHIRQFVIMLGIYGGLYFIGFPLLQTINLIVARYLRHRVMEIGTITIRTLAILLLTHLFTSKKSIFAKISYENKSFLDRNKDD